MASSQPASPRDGTLGLVILFATMYFVQGVAEPNEGLIAQPVRSLLRSWGRSTAEIASFGAILSLPWSLKPLFGLLTDFIPFLGTRRRGYLLASTLATALSLGLLYLVPLKEGADSLLLMLLVVPTFGVAFSDVVTDAVMIERGQPHGLTGRLQSVQWGAMYVATIATGIVGGLLSQRGRQDIAFLICALATLLTTALTWGFVREKRVPPVREVGRFRAALRSLVRTARSRRLWPATTFICLWSFNPFGSAVLYVHATETLGLDDATYGVTTSCLAVGAIAASVVYGAICRRVPFRALIHVSIVAGILSTAAYWGLRGPVSAYVISVFVGFSYMVGCLVLFDLAARSCPLETAGTTFALIMGLSNLSLSLAVALGGGWYDAWSLASGERVAFDRLVLIGALANALCWIVVPFLARVREDSDAR